MNEWLSSHVNGVKTDNEPCSRVLVPIARAHASRRKGQQAVELFEAFSITYPRRENCNRKSCMTTSQ